jgi:hypothetical protein
MEWWLKGAIVGAGVGVVSYFTDRKLVEMGVDGPKRSAVLGAIQVIAWIALARGIGDEDANPATPE